MHLTELYAKCDLHVHSILSPCAHMEMDLKSILNTCHERGIEFLGITDHITATIPSDILWETKRALSAMDKPMKVYLGCEADIIGVGQHTVTDEMRADLDFIAVSANHFHNPMVAQPQSDAVRAIASHYLAMFEYACTLDFADIIVHPLYVMPGTHDPACLNYLDDQEILSALSIAKENRVAIEISPRSLASDQMGFRLRFLSLCKQTGVKFSIGSDAHRLEMAGMTRMVAPIIEKIGIVDEDIWLPGEARC